MRGGRSERSQHERRLSLLAGPAGLAAAALPLLRTAPASDLPPALAADVPTRSSQIACVHDYMLHHFHWSRFLQCWRLASYLHMAKLIVRNALLVVAVGRPRVAPPRLRQRNAVHGRHSTFLHQLAARCAAAAALTWRRAPRACARAARSACASRSWTHAAVIAPRQPARGRPRRARAAPSLLRELCIRAAGRAHVPRWPGRPLFACVDFLLEQRCARRLEPSRSRRTRTC